MSALAEPGQESLLLSSHREAAPKVLQSFGTVARGARSGSGSGDRLPSGLLWTQLGVERAPETPWEAGGVEVRRGERGIPLETGFLPQGHWKKHFPWRILSSSACAQLAALDCTM